MSALMVVPILPPYQGSVALKASGKTDNRAINLRGNWNQHMNCGSSAEGLLSRQGAMRSAESLKDSTWENWKQHGVR